MMNFEFSAILSTKSTTFFSWVSDHENIILIGILFWKIE